MRPEDTQMASGRDCEPLGITVLAEIKSTDTEGQNLAALCSLIARIKTMNGVEAARRCIAYAVAKELPPPRERAMTEITIPREALEAGKDTAFAWLRSHMEDDVRVQNMTDEELGELVEAACLAMLAAWPGMAVNDGCPVWHAYPHITLPFPQEKTDVEA